MNDACIETLAFEYFVDVVVIHIRCFYCLIIWRSKILVGLVWHPGFLWVLLNLEPIFKCISFYRYFWSLIELYDFLKSSFIYLWFLLKFVCIISIWFTVNSKTTIVFFRNELNIFIFNDWILYKVSLVESDGIGWI